MPTFNQLVRKGRQTSVKKSTAPALQRSFNSLQKKSKEILLIQAPTSADYLSVCSFWKHIGKNRE